MANDPSAKLRNLVATHDEPIEGIVRRVVRELGGLRERAIIELRLLGGENPNSVTKFTVVLSHAGASLLPHNVQNPTLLAITTVETFREMVNGSYSPFSAHMDGKLTVQGNVELGLKVFGHFAAPGVQTPAPRTPAGHTGGPSQAQSACSLPHARQRELESGQPRIRIWLADSQRRILHRRRYRRNQLQLFYLQQPISADTHRGCVWQIHSHPGRHTVRKQRRNHRT
jgi:SCP-2 sterol transfer family